MLTFGLSDKAANKTSNLLIFDNKYYELEGIRRMKVLHDLLPLCKLSSFYHEQAAGVKEPVENL